MKDVGIVMPVYKQDPVYLELALLSILEQNYRNFYFVIVSDGAPEETVPPDCRMGGPLSGNSPQIQSACFPYENQSCSC